LELKCKPTFGTSSASSRDNQSAARKIENQEYINVRLSDDGRTTIFHMKIRKRAIQNSIKVFAISKMRKLQYQHNADRTDDKAAMNITPREVSVIKDLWTYGSLI